MPPRGNNNSSNGGQQEQMARRGSSGGLELITEAQHQGRVRTRDRKYLYWRRYQPTGVGGSTHEGYGTVVIVHGFGEHVGSYEVLAQHIVQKSGYQVVSYDQRGYGQSEGKRGHVDSANQVLSDLQLIIKEVVVTRPVYLFGHSSGGLWVLLYGIKMELDSKMERVDGVISSAPYLKLTVDIPIWQKRVISFISKVWKSYSIEAAIDPQKLTHDEHMQKIYQEDPLLTWSISAKHLVEISKAGLYVLQNASKLTVPLFVTHGSEDLVTDYRASQQFYENVSSVDKQFMLEWGLYHDLHMEIQRDSVFNRVTYWLSRRHMLLELIEKEENSQRSDIDSQPTIELAYNQGQQQP